MEYIVCNYNYKRKKITQQKRKKITKELLNESQKKKKVFKTLPHNDGDDMSVN